MAERIRRDEAADVVIVSGAQIDSLTRQSKVVAGSRIDIAKVGIGLFVQKGARKPDISTVEAFTRTMLAATSIGWNDPVAGAPVSIYMLGAFERLGIADAMKPKTVPFKQRTERFAPVARGEIEIGFNQISEIIVAPGVELLGPLPALIQNHTLFAGGIVTATNVPTAGTEFLRFISAPAAQAIWQANGFELP